MNFAKYTFIGAGVWGCLTLVPLYFLTDITGRAYAPTDYLHFYYGFVSVALAWQVAFIVIGSDPARYRSLMLVGILEKAGYIIGATTLHVLDRITAVDAESAVPDAILLALFAVAFVKTRHASAHRAS
jgi:hypothetical protein